MSIPTENSADAAAIRPFTLAITPEAEIEALRARVVPHVGPKTKTGWCELPTTPQLAETRLNVNDARYLALFASGLQPSEAPTAETVAQAINRAIRRLGVRGCVARMAQEFGDHPDAAAARMCWARQLAVWPQASVPGGHEAVAGREAA
jgi:hypothetical protein